MSKIGERYRQEALANLYSKEKYDNSLAITNVSTWIYLVIVFISLSSFSFWLFWGSLNDEITGEGLLFFKNVNLTSITSDDSGHINQLFVKSGEEIKKDSPVLKLKNVDLNAKIEGLNLTIKRKKQFLKSMEQEAERQSQIYKDNIQARITLLNDRNRLIQEEKLFITNLIEKSSTNLNNIFIQLKEAYYAVENSETEIKTKNLSLDLRQELYLSSWQEKLNRHREAIWKLEQELKLLEKRQQALNSILSPADGIIYLGNLNLGDYVQAHEKIGDLIKSSEGLELLVLVKANQAKRIKPGMQAHVFFKHLNSMEHGSVNATVRFVGKFPANPERMTNILKNKELVNSLFHSGIMYTVHLDLAPSQDSNHLIYKWKSANGELQILTAGTLAQVRIIVKQTSPIAAIIPLLSTEGKDHEL